MGCTLNFVASSVPTAELAGIITSMAGILFATLAYGLWTYNETARKTTIALNYIGAALTIIQAFTKAIGHPTTLTPTCVITSLISIGIAIAINLYLQTEEVLDLFDDHEDQNWRNYHNR